MALANESAASSDSVGQSGDEEAGGLLPALAVDHAPSPIHSDADEAPAAAEELTLRRLRAAVDCGDRGQVLAIEAAVRPGDEAQWRRLVQSLGPRQRTLDRLLKSDRDCNSDAGDSRPANQERKQRTVSLDNAIHLALNLRPGSGNGHSSSNNGNAGGVGLSGSSLDRVVHTALTSEELEAVRRRLAGANLSDYDSCADPLSASGVERLAGVADRIRHYQQDSCDVWNHSALLGLSPTDTTVAGDANETAALRPGHNGLFRSILHSARGSSGSSSSSSSSPQSAAAAESLLLSPASSDSGRQAPASPSRRQPISVELPTPEAGESQRVASLEAQLAWANQQLAEARREQRDVQSENRSLRQRLQRLASRQLHDSTDCQQLQQQLQQSRSDCEQLEQQLQQSRSDCEHLQQLLLHSRGDCDRLRQQLASADSSLHFLHNRDRCHGSRTLPTDGPATEEAEAAEHTEHSTEHSCAAEQQPREVSDIERRYDQLQEEKRQLECQLSHVPACGSARYSRQARTHRDNVEKRLDSIDHELGALRMRLRQSHVIKSAH